MLANMVELVKDAQQRGYALGAFNVYNLEGVKAVVSAAERNHSAVVLQIHPAALRYGGQPLIALCLAQGQHATVPVAVHLDHSSSLDNIVLALDAGVSSVMADGSHDPYEENVTYVRQAVAMAHDRNVSVEAELGLISGTEDGITVADYEARMTDPAQAADFVAATGVDLLAVCVGNVHGPYLHEPFLDFDRLEKIRDYIDVPLVLHGASGLPDALVQRAIELGVCKFNVNTELRQAYFEAVRDFEPNNNDLLDLLNASIVRMSQVVENKLRLFGSVGSLSNI